jgi:hypothetical protein
MHPDPVGGHLIGTPFVGKQQCLCPFAFLGAVFPLVDDVMEFFFFFFRERYPIFLFWHSSPRLLVPMPAIIELFIPQLQSCINTSRLATMKMWISEYTGIIGRLTGTA